MACKGYSSMLVNLMAWVVCCCVTGVLAGAINPTSSQLTRSNNETGIAKREETSLSPIIITCVILSLIFFFFIILLHFIRTRGCEQIVNSFKLKNYQMKFSLPRISFKNRKQKPIPAPVLNPSQEKNNMTATSDDPTLITQEKPGHAQEDGKAKRSSRLFDAIRSTLKRNSSIISVNNPLLTVHREVASFEQEALTLLTNVMTKHLTEEDEDPKEEDIEEKPSPLPASSTSSSSSSPSPSTPVQTSERKSSLHVNYLSAIHYSDDSDGECEVTYLDDSDGGLVTTL